MQDVPANGGYERVTAQSCRTGTAQMLTRIRNTCARILASFLIDGGWSIAPCAREATGRQGCGERKQVAVAAGSQNRPFLDSYQEVNYDISCFPGQSGKGHLLTEGAVFAVATAGIRPRRGAGVERVIGHGLGFLAEQSIIRHG